MQMFQGMRAVYCATSHKEKSYLIAKICGGQVASHALVNMLV